MITATQTYRDNPASTLSDWSDIAELQERLVESVTDMEAMTNDVGMARQVREFNSDQRKRVLAVVAFPLVKAGQSSAAADTEARASEQYKAAMKQLSNELTAAEQTIAKYECLNKKWESARSLLSMKKAQVQIT
jgi:hypothetical protein